MVNSKEKKYSEYKKTRPVQLELFELKNIFKDKRDNYSGTVELYDILPKYYHGDVEKIRTIDGLLKSLTREFVYRKQPMILKISPAQIDTKDGEKAFYPSQREEIIEDVLRKFATDPNRNEFLDDKLSVKFTLYDLWKELKVIKHPYHYGEIIEALNILHKTNIEIKTANNKITFSSNMFETFGIINNNDITEYTFSNFNEDETDDKYSKKITYFVRFNSLVSDSIKDKTWRMLNYKQSMKYKKFVSRWLHKKISHMFMTNKIEIPYNILLTTIIRDSGMTKYDRFRDNLIQVQKCLNEMVEIGSLEKYEVEKIFSEEKKNKIVDAKFLLYISLDFFNDLKLNYFTLETEKKQIESNSLKISDNFICEEQKNNLKDEVRKLLKNYNVKDKDLNKIVNYKKNKSINNIKNNILSALDYIKKENKKGKECNIMAIIISSIKEDWGVQAQLFNNEEFRELNKDNKILTNEIIKKISNRDYKKISKELLKYFGTDIYMAWLSNLNFEKIDKKRNILILSCNNNFIIDTIKKDYLDGIKRKVNNEYVWVKKGVKQIVEEIKTDIKDVEIMYKE